MKARLTRDFMFEAAQTLPRVPEGHRCAKLHGHSFKVEITVEGEVNAETGWIFDHKRIADVVRPVVDQLDHGYLNEVPGLENPTIENICAWLWQRIKPDMPELCEILIHETAGARCIFRGEF